MNALDKEIIRSYADHNMNLLAASRDVHRDPKTLEYHIERVKRTTGLNAKVFRDLVALLEKIEEEEG